MFDIGDTIAGSEGRDVQEMFNAFVAQRLFSAHVAESMMGELAQECKRVALELANEEEDVVCDCCGCRWDAPPERDKEAYGTQKKEKEKKKSSSKHPFRILPAADWVDHDHKDGVTTRRTRVAGAVNSQTCGAGRGRSELGLRS